MLIDGEKLPIFIKDTERVNFRIISNFKDNAIAGMKSAIFVTFAVLVLVSERSLSESERLT